MVDCRMGVVALTMLTGCAAFEARAPRPFAPHTEEKDGVVVSESTFESADGWVHFERSWRPKTDARGMLVIVHGLKDHSARYADFAVGLAKQGFSVRSYDHRGHGRSDGKSQRVDDFRDFETDLDSFVRRGKQAEVGVPVFVLGHSMGGAIATGYVLDHQADVAGLLLSAPALATDAGGGAKFGAHVASALFPGAGATALPIAKFSRSPEVVAAANSDPFVDQSDVPARTIAGLLDAMDHIAESRSAFTLPILGMHGEADEITLPSGTRDFVAGVSSKDRTLWSCPKMVHDLLHEPEGAAMIDGVTRWLEAHTTPRGEAATVPIDSSPTPAAGPGKWARDAPEGHGPCRSASAVPCGDLLRDAPRGSSGPEEALSGIGGWSERCLRYGPGRTRRRGPSDETPVAPRKLWELRPSQVH